METINKSYTNNYNQFVTQVNQQQQCEREGGIDNETQRKQTQQQAT